MSESSTSTYILFLFIVYERILKDPFLYLKGFPFLSKNCKAFLRNTTNLSCALLLTYVHKYRDTRARTNTCNNHCILNEYQLGLRIKFVDLILSKIINAILNKNINFNKIRDIIILVVAVFWHWKLIALVSTVYFWLTCTKHFVVVECILSLLSKIFYSK